MLNIQQLGDQLQTVIAISQYNMPFTIGVIVVLWVIAILNWMLHYQLNLLGIRPRNAFGLIGIVCAPFLHGDFNHVFFNSVPLFVLMNLILIFGKPLFFAVTFIIVVVSGVLTWLFGRRAIHVGASGVIMGYFAYILFEAYKTPGIISAISFILVIYYFGGLFLALIPRDRRVSFEGHLFGFISGVVAVWFWPLALFLFK